MATAFAPAVFGSPVFSQQAFGNGPCPGPGPCGPPGEEEFRGGALWHEHEKRQRDDRMRRARNLRQQREIAEFIRILLASDIL